MIRHGFAPPPPPPARWVWFLKLSLSVCLILCTAGFVARSWHWPLVGDAPLIHYVVFLMARGMAPYRQIVDLNLPVTLAVEAAVMTLLGKGSLAWRVFDLGLLAVTGLAMAAICGRRGRFAALWAATIFALIHGRDGLIQLGQRDLLMAALLAAGYACLFVGLRRDWYGLAAPAGFCLGCAGAVKPDALLLALPLLGLAAYQARRLGRGWRLPFGLAVTGWALPLMLSVGFLLRERAAGAFLALMTQLAPYHASLWRLPASTLMAGAVSSVLLPLFCLWLPVFAAAGRWRLFEDQALLLGFLFGVFSYYVQGRGYPYHRYPSEVFLLLLAARAFEQSLSAEPKVLRACSIAGLGLGALVTAPRSLQAIAHCDERRDQFEQTLGAELEGLGGAAALDGSVQCLDMAGGCVAALYRERLAESSGFLYDCYLYPADEKTRDPAAERARYREAFRAAMLARPPLVLVVSSDECGPADFTYRKLDRWPWLASYVGRRYRMVDEWRPPAAYRRGGKPALPYGYRIYRLAEP